jgi:hypothetical protein
MLRSTASMTLMVREPTMHFAQDDGDVANEAFISPRWAAAFALGVAVLGALARFTPETSEWGWIARVGGASLIVGVAPGAVTLLAWRPRQSFALLEWLGLSIGISCAVVQLVTIGAVALHQSPGRGIGALGLVVAVHLWMCFRRGDSGPRVRVSRSDVALLLALAALGLFLYAEGSPIVAQQEGRVHISIIQRLSQLATPAIDNVYLSPGVVYTYPFPGTHYAMALMSRVGDIEPAFLYHKLRAFWGLAAVVILWGSAHAIFESRRIANATALVAIAFVANGTFAAWSQMAPFSHAADVAMGVLLPALLLMAFTYFRAVEPREERFFLVGTLGIALVLVMVHPREIVQFLVYLAAFAITLIAARGPRVLRTRTALLLVLVISVLAIYQLWYRLAVPEVGSLVSERRPDLESLFTGSSWAELFGQPLPMLDRYMPAFGLIFRWWMPVILLGSPVVLYLLRHRPLAWMLASGIAVYMAVIRFPVFAIPYVYATYWEILYAPVRKVAVFAHLLAGVSAYILAARLARHGYTILCIAALGLAWAAVELFRRLGPATLQQPDVLFLPVLAGYLLALAGLLLRRGVRPPEWLERPPRRWGLALALILGPIAAATWVGESAVAKLPWNNQQPTPAALLASIGCGDELDRCAPPPSLIQFVRTEISPEAIFAVDYRQVHEPTLFLPQQVNVWSGASDGLIDPEPIFPVYFKYLERAHAASLEQPFFNDRDTRSERLAFIRDLAVTHLLITPRVYRMMTEVLARDRDIFVSRYDDGRWALYEVRR